MSAESATVTPIRRRPAPKGPENVLTEGAVNAAEVLSRVHQALTYLRNVEHPPGELCENFKMGRYWIDGMVLDAVEHAEELATAERV